MSRLATAVYLALLINPFLALAAIAPYVLLSYRRTKTVHAVRCGHLYLMIFFILCAFFMTMLPFPSMESVLKMKGSGVQLIPFYCLYDFFANSSLNPSDWTTIFPALSGSISLGVIFNIIMLFPVGVFLRSLFHISARRAVAIGFCISLFFELTQLSGLFFIYPRPYRVFDVDDLMQNTLGVWLGYAAEPLFERILPSAKGRQIVRQGGEMSMRRRLLADFVDQSIVIWLSVLAVAALRVAVPALGRAGGLAAFPQLFVCYMAVSMLYALALVRLHGRSAGLRLSGLQLRSTRGGGLRPLPCMLRQAVYGVTLSLPLWIAFFIDLSSPYAGLRSILCTAASAACAFAYVCYLLSVFLHVVTHGEPLIFDRLSHTHLGFDPGVRAVQRKRALYAGALNEAGIEPGVQTVFAILMNEGIERKKSMRVQYMAEGVLLEWMENGLRDRDYTVQMTERFFHRTILISVPGECVPLTRQDDSYLEVLSGTRLSFDAYYTGGANVFAVEVP